MQTEIFAFCDAATVTAGKLNILGSFDGGYPGQQALCAAFRTLHHFAATAALIKLAVYVVFTDGVLIS